MRQTNDTLDLYDKNEVVILGKKHLLIIMQNYLLSTYFGNHADERLIPTNSDGMYRRTCIRGWSNDDILVSSIIEASFLLFERAKRETKVVFLSILESYLLLYHPLEENFTL